MGLSAALGIAANAIDVFSTGIEVTGQNIANANTPGYIQEQLQVQPGASYLSGALILGTGVDATGVTQEINQFLQVQIDTANSNYNASNARSSVYTQLQTELNALGTGGLSTQVTAFENAINNLANQPESAPLRQEAVDQGTQLASSISSLRTSVDTQRQNANVQVQQLVSQANTLIQQIASLNPQITKLESSGLLQSQAGSQRDQQLQDLQQLSQIIPITYTQQSDGSVAVYTNSDYLILNGSMQQLQTVASGDRGVPTDNVRLSVTHSSITANSPGTGELRGVLQGRDNILGGFVDNLNQLASSVISQFNDIYASGQGTDGFTSVTSQNAVNSPTAALTQAGLAFPPQNGSFDIEVTNTAAGTTTTSTIPVNLTGSPGDTTLNSLAAAINGVANVSATVTSDGHLQISAAPNFQIKFSNDTSNTLAGLGINTFFTGTDSSNIGVNAVVANNPNLFATGQGGGPSDGSNALALSQFATTPVASLNGTSVTGFYNSIVTGIGDSASAESTMASSLQDFANSLQSQEQQFSGVSLDEQAVKLMQYQQTYQAAARVVSTVDQLFQTLVQI